jgi:hypothetical protein
VLELVLFPGMGSARSKNSAVYCAPVFESRDAKGNIFLLNMTS